MASVLLVVKTDVESFPQTLEHKNQHTRGLGVPGAASPTLWPSAELPLAGHLEGEGSLV